MVKVIEITKKLQENKLRWLTYIMRYIGYVGGRVKEKEVEGRRITGGPK